MGEGSGAEGLGPGRPGGGSVWGRRGRARLGWGRAAGMGTGGESTAGRGGGGGGRDGVRAASGG